MVKFLLGFITALALAAILAVVLGDQSGAAEIDAMARLEAVRGQNAVNLVAAHSEAFVRESIIFLSFLSFLLVIFAGGVGFLIWGASDMSSPRGYK